MATHSADADAQLHDLRALPHRAIPLHGHTDEVTALAFSPDSRWVATGSVDDTIRVWDLRDGPPGTSSKLLRGHGDRIEQLAFTPSSERLLSGSGGGTVRIWPVAGPLSGEPPLVLRAAAAGVLSLAVIDGGRFFVTGGSDGIRVWPLTTDQLVAEARRVAGRELRPTEVAAFLPPPPPPEPGWRDRFAAAWRWLRSILPSNGSAPLR